MTNMNEENIGSVPTKTRKEERREADKAKENSRIVRQVITWGVTVFVIIGAAAGIVWSVKNGGAPAGGAETTSAITANDWVRGSETATVEMVEYSDFQCPACALYHPIVKKLVEEDSKGKIKFSYRHFPLIEIHPTSVLSAVASEAAGKQGKFWQMHDKLFENQTTWGSNPKAREIFIDYAKELGLDVAKFTADLDSKELKDKIVDAYKSSIRMGLNSTPTFFINGKKIQNPQSYEAFRDLLNQTITATTTSNS